MRKILLILSLSLVVLPAVAVAQDVSEDTPPAPVPRIESPDYDIINFMLLGSDTANPRNSGRTDVILIVSVNRTTGTIALLSVPRDLFVYVPGHGMQRINTAYGYGELAQAGMGPQLLRDTLQYNLGLKIDDYARVDFNDFKNIIDAVGGVDVSVDCAIQDWRLREPQLDPADEANWVTFTLPIGIQHMDGDLALWYARSRRTSSDFDRGVRQQEIMRALWRHTRELGLLSQLADVWPELLDIVETDIPLSELVNLMPLAINLTESHLTSYTFRLNTEVISGYAPDGAQVLFPRQEAVAELIGDFLSPPTFYYLHSSPPIIKIENASGDDDLGQIVGDQLSWHGFSVVVSGNSPDRIQQLSAVYDHTGRTKGSDLQRVLSVLHISEERVFLEPDADRQYDYEISIGSAYYPCSRNVLVPKTESESS